MYNCLYFVSVSVSASVIENTTVKIDVAVIVVFIDSLFTASLCW